MNVWRLTAHHADPEAVVKWSRATGRIAVGWGATGSIRGYTSASDIASTTRLMYPGLHNAPFSGVQLWNFCYVMKPDDLVILSTGKQRSLVVQVEGPYEYVLPENAPLLGDYQHQRRVRITPIDPDKLWRLAGAKQASGHNIRWTLIQCLNAIDKTMLAA